MTLTIKSAVAEVGNLDESIQNHAGYLQGDLLGLAARRRRNSGVILSQLLRGFGRLSATRIDHRVQVTADTLPVRWRLPAKPL